MKQAEAANAKKVEKEVEKGPKTKDTVDLTKNQDPEAANAKKVEMEVEQGSKTKDTVDLTKNHAILKRYLKCKGIALKKNEEPVEKNTTYVHIRLLHLTYTNS